MSERLLRNIFFAGTALFLIVLAVLTLDSLAQVASARTPALTDAVIQGKRVWQDRNCNDCHTILGIGAYYAPDMTKVATRRDAVWLTKFLQSPATVKPGTTMPDQRITAGEADALVAFLAWTSGIDTNGWPPAPRIATSAALLLEQKGCTACHRVGGTGADGPGPDLTRVGARLTPTALGRWLESPESMRAGTDMPPFDGTPDERNAIVQYLESLK